MHPSLFPWLYTHIDPPQTQTRDPPPGHPDPQALPQHFHTLQTPPRRLQPSQPCHRALHRQAVGRTPDRRSTRNPQVRRQSIRTAASQAIPRRMQSTRKTATTSRQPIHQTPSMANSHHTINKIKKRRKSAKQPYDMDTRTSHNPHQTTPGHQNSRRLGQTHQHTP